MGIPTGIWQNPDAVDRLTELWRRGESAGRIAKIFGGESAGITRNVIIGKIYRLGLNRRTSPQKFTLFDSRKRPEPKVNLKTKDRLLRDRFHNQESVRRLHAAARVDLNALDARRGRSRRLDGNELTDIKNTVVSVPEDERRGILQATRHQCRWPYGNPASSDFYFCHLDRDGDLPFCKIHRYHAYQRPYSQRSK